MKYVAFLFWVWFRWEWSSGADAMRGVVANYCEQL